MDSAPAPRQTGAAEADAKSDARPDDEKKKKEQGKKKAQRRRYLLAKDEIKKAQRALNVGQLEQAVRTSHSAFQRSADPRIFEAMIKVHLRAASKRPPQIKFFEEEKGWLLCALNDDGTNEEVQAALAGRYMRHVEQLVDLRTKEAHHAAVNSLKELRQYIPLPQLAASWLQELQKAKPGDARLTPGSAQPESP